jgi:hypothetical protein
MATQYQLSKESERDERWMKFRTKGGHLIQLSDIGFHPQDDDLRQEEALQDEVGNKTDKEADWKGKDARWIRLCTRYGYKLVLDDRGSDARHADTKEHPLGNGLLLKGRRSPGSQGKPSEHDDPRGFQVEFNENDATNQATVMSPLGTVLQLNDKHQYVMLVSRRSDYPTKWQGLKENEFVLGAVAAAKNEKQPDGTDKKVPFEELSHHLKIDHHNEYVRFKTRAGRGDGPDGEPVNKPSVGQDFGTTINQGLEARDGEHGDGAWCELVDAAGRNLWFWGKGRQIMCHARMLPEPIKIMWWMDEDAKSFVLRNGEDGGKIQIFADDVEIIAKKSVKLHAAEAIHIKSDDRLVLSGGSTDVEIGGDGVKSTQKIKAPEFPTETPSVDAPKLPEPASPPQLSPTDRGKRYNENLDEPAPRSEIEHPLGQ